MDKNGITILIPAYEPDGRMIELIDALQGYRIVVVDDGSGERCAQLFEQARQRGCTVLRHERNRGKGRAIKTGIEYVLAHGATPVVTVDADGQHLPKDVERLAQAAHEHPEALIIGSRAFSGRVPIRSRMGNAITRGVFSAATGRRVFDTQTGLRALPASALAAMLELPGERYEFEIEMLLRAGEMGLEVREVPIETVYHSENGTSHFNTVRDAWRIYKRIVTYAASSLLGALVDIGVFSLLTALGLELWWSVVIARAVSVAVNYLVNTFVVFAQKRIGWSLVKFLALALVVMVLNYYLTLGLSAVMNVYAAKVLANALLFAVSYFAQVLLVYRARRGDGDAKPQKTL